MINMINVVYFVSIVTSFINFTHFLSFNHDFPKVIILALDFMSILEVLFQFVYSFIYLMFQAIPLHRLH